MDVRVATANDEIRSSHIDAGADLDAPDAEGSRGDADASTPRAGRSGFDPIVRERYH